MPKVSPYQWAAAERETKVFTLGDTLNEGKSIVLTCRKLNKLKVSDCGSLAQKMVDDLAANRLQIQNPTGEEVVLTPETAFVAQAVALAQFGGEEEKYSAVEVVQFMAMSDELVERFCEVAAWVVPGEEPAAPLASPAPSLSLATPPDSPTPDRSSTGTSSSGASTSDSGSSPAEEGE